jgi:Flp pilus assembly protein TadB
VFPIAIGASIFGIVALLFFALGGDLRAQLARFASSYQAKIDRADISAKPEDYVLALLGISVVLWLLAAFVLHAAVAVTLLIFPVAIVATFFGGSYYLTFRGNRRVDTFVQQLELVLRMLSGALRVGLGLRQAIILVTEEIPDPARRELMRVIGRTNIGVTIVDALEDLSRSMPCNEMEMFARVVKVQQSTGGDLAKVLEKLGNTIRDRRRVFRKMNALTAQGRFGAFIIGALPILVGGFVVGTQPAMGNALMHTTPGVIALVIFTVLEGLAIFSLNKILQFDV